MSRTPKQQKIRLRPLDTLFFGEGRSFSQTDAGLSASASRFPPLPSTLSGALMAALGEALGHNQGHGTDWLKSADWLKKNGQMEEAESLQALKMLATDQWDWQKQNKPPVCFSGPFLHGPQTKETVSSWFIYYPAPLTLYRRKPRKNNDTDPPEKFGILLPKKIQDGGGDGGLTHVPHLHCVETDRDKRKAYEPLAGYWLRSDKYKEYLQEPQEFIGEFTKASGDGTDNALSLALIGPDQVHSLQEHIGIGRDALSHVTRDGQLYAASHVRLGNDTRETKLSLWARIDWNRDKVPALPAFLPLGGEGRAVFAATDKNSTDIFSKPIKNNKDSQKNIQPWVRHKKILFQIVALTPVPCGNGRFGLPDPMPGQLKKCRVISAVCPRPEQIGIWSSAEKKTKLFQVFPAGSTWFLEKDVTNPSKASVEALSLYNTALNDRLGPKKLTWMGFGQFAIGGLPQAIDKEKT